MKQAPILSFTGDYRWLSNFWPSPVRLTIPGEKNPPEIADLTYPSVENAYQAAKAEPRQRHHFIPLSAGEAKRRGRGLVIRPDWEDIKVAVMRGLVRQKFAPGSDLGHQLLATGEAEIIEGNTWGDTFWGVCRGSGLNTLGKLLMERRHELRLT